MLFEKALSFGGFFILKIFFDKNGVNHYKSSTNPRLKPWAMKKIVNITVSTVYGNNTTLK
jgi:hypothetical protein